MFNVPVKYSYYEKLKLYSEFLKKDSLYRNKLWDGCKIILAWASSGRHRHLGSYLDTDKVCLVLGIYKEGYLQIMNGFTGQNIEALIGRLENLSEEESKKGELSKLKKIQIKQYIKFLENHQENDKNFREKIREITSKVALKYNEIPKCFSDEFKKRVIKKNIDNWLKEIGQMIKNLSVMGFGDLEIKEGKTVDAVRINRRGLLMGELLLENLGKLNKYSVVNWLFACFIILLFVYSLGFLIYKIFIGFKYILCHLSKIFLSC